MTPKEKAKELFDKYQDAGSKWYIETTKKYALIAVDEILNYIGEEDTIYPSPQFEFWKEVKEEINKL